MMISPFLATFLFGAALGNESPATSQPTTGPAYVVPADRPWWEREGLVIASVNEVLADRAWRISGGRTREPATQERRAYEEERSEPVLAKLREMGITLVLVPYGGYGPDKIEHEERKIARETIERCHKVGLKCGVWLPVGQLDPNVWKAEEPDVEKWLVRSASGRPMAAQGGRQYVSSLQVPLSAQSPCPLLDEAVGQANADAVFVPDWRIAFGHESGSELVMNVMAASADKRAGSTLADALRKNGLPKDGSSPLISEWVKIRAMWLAHDTELMLRRAIQLNKEELFGIDCGGPSRQIGMVDGPAVDPASLLRGVNVVMVLSVPRVDERERVSHQIVEMKTATTVGCRAAMAMGTKLGMAQQLAFGGDCAGIVAYFNDGKLSSDEFGQTGVWTDILTLANAYRRERVFFAGMRPAADVIVYQPQAARLFGGPAADVAQIQACNALVTHRIPFSFNFDDRPKDIPHDAVVMIAGVPSLNEDQAGDLRAHVMSGGGLLVIGTTTVQDSAGKTVGRDLSDYITERSSGPAEKSSPKGRLEIVIRKFEQGRVVSMARPRPALNMWLTTRKDRKARVAGAIESDEFAEAVRTALGRPLSVEGAFERGSAIELTRDADGKRTALHVVNFTADTPLPATAVQVRVPNAAAVRHVWRFPALGAGGCTEVTFRLKDGAVAFETESNALYDAYLIQ